MILNIILRDFNNDVAIPLEKIESIKYVLKSHCTDFKNLTNNNVYFTRERVIFYRSVKILVASMKKIVLNNENINFN